MYYLITEKFLNSVEHGESARYCHLKFIVAFLYILYFPIAHNALCLPHKFCMNYCFGNMQSSQENLKTIVYAKFGGQTKCIMGNWKIENVGTNFEVKKTS